MDILAPTVETNTVEKVTFQYIISHENWIENRKQ